jgi:hypothetical protein
MKFINNYYETNDANNCIQPKVQGQPQVFFNEGNEKAGSLEEISSINSLYM